MGHNYFILSSMLKMGVLILDNIVLLTYTSFPHQLKRTILRWIHQCFESLIFVPDREHKDQIKKSQQDQSQRIMIADLIKLIGDEKTQKSDGCRVSPAFTLQQSSYQ